MNSRRGKKGDREEEMSLAAAEAVVVVVRAVAAAAVAAAAAAAARRGTKNGSTRKEALGRKINRDARSQERLLRSQKRRGR